MDSSIQFGKFLSKTKVHWTIITTIKQTIKQLKHKIDIILTILLTECATTI
jgi:hypothetical protein